MFSDADSLSVEIFSELANCFPITCASDEFVFFPQAQPKSPDWHQWDRFSPEDVNGLTQQIRHWEETLRRIRPGITDETMEIDLIMIQQAVRTLREQLGEVRAWESQPSFYLMIANIGLTEAISSMESDALAKRAETLPSFLDQARRNLRKVPELFRDIGLAMLKDTRAYFSTLRKHAPEMERSIKALARFETHLTGLTPLPDFRQPPELVARIFRSHLGTGMDIETIGRLLDNEIEQMEQFLRSASLERNSIAIEGKNRAHWSEIIERIPFPPMEPGGLVSCYRDEVRRLAAHCRENGFVSQAVLTACPVNVAPVPSYLSAIRTASSYSIPPGHPPVGGTFYIINADLPDEARRTYQKEYRILCAHETYPGHHLLDISRWGLKRPSRRMIERPLFYEGWACFAEELMRVTGYFTEAENLLLARRRLWRAIRGKVDLGLQTGTMDLNEAAALIAETGVAHEHALAAVRKYPLNPGYQLCYSVGLHRFLRLFRRYGLKSPSRFVGCVLSQGEIDFKHLETVLKRTLGYQAKEQR
jgi:uncharacterized protein (DUF885 family)